MARPRRPIAPQLVDHVVARGNHRQATFRSPDDYSAYQDRLIRYQIRHRTTLHAYCLMPNHVHLLIGTSEVPISKFMQGVQQSYTQWFNRAHGTVGHLFQGRYRSLVCDRDEYLIVLVGYIHLNPVRAGLADRPEQYPYSSHSAYLRGESSPLQDPARALGLLGGPDGYRRYIRDELAADAARPGAATAARDAGGIAEGAASDAQGTSGGDRGIARATADRTGRELR